MGGCGWGGHSSSAPWWCLRLRTRRAGPHAQRARCARAVYARPPAAVPRPAPRPALRWRALQHPASDRAGRSGPKQARGCQRRVGRGPGPCRLHASAAGGAQVIGPLCAVRGMVWPAKHGDPAGGRTQGALRRAGQARRGAAGVVHGRPDDAAHGLLGDLPRLRRDQPQAPDRGRPEHPLGAPLLTRPAAGSGGAAVWKAAAERPPSAVPFMVRSPGGWSHVFYFVFCCKLSAVRQGPLLSAAWPVVSGASTLNKPGYSR